MLSGLADEVHHTMGSCKSSGWITPEIDLESAMSEMETAEADFNDYLLSAFCKKNNLILVTHDRDFAGLDVDIITANERLARARPA